MLIVAQQNVQQNDLPISQQWWWGVLAPIVIAILGAIIVHSLKNRFDNAKKIAIVGNSILNINNRNGLPEPVISGQQLYSNFVLNTLTVENKRSTTQSVTEIELYNIRKNNNDFQDIQYDGGFYERNQKFALLAYNNGTKESMVDQYIVKFTGLEKDTFKKIYETKKVLQNPLILKSGDIKSLIILPFDEFVSEFEQDSRLASLKVAVFDSKGEELHDLILIVNYNREEKRFYSPDVDGEEVILSEGPLIDLRENVSQNSTTCSQKLMAGANKVCFSVLVDRSCKLKYNVALKCGKKRIEDKQKYSIDIRVPVYKQERGTFYGDFYSFLFEMNHALNDDIDYNKDLINTLKSDLIYDKYYAARTFANANI
ncbi:hypothetical protein [Streptococcus sanguinis]|uniref:Uncharacterized protein n=1 Tax=Streptococcus sanguinis TaxID=1305 RepID=A0A3R9GN45_STRSA|nr:hypothetical protein [Streptococcus sanguinis]RSI08144.1 hypothetical protein D8887_09725 [Streptococcus sanguinis]